MMMMMMMMYWLYCWVSQKVCLVFFCKIKDTFFLFSPITLLIWTFWVCWLSPIIGFQWVEARGAAKHLPMHKRASPTAKNYLAKMSIVPVLQTCFDTFIQSQHLLRTLHKSFFVCFNYAFTFLKIIKHNTLKMLRIFFHVQYLKWMHKNSPNLMFFLNAHWYDSCHNTI